MSVFMSSSLSHFLFRLSRYVAGVAALLQLTRHVEEPAKPQAPASAHCQYLLALHRSTQLHVSTILPHKPLRLLMMFNSWEGAAQSIR